MCGEKYNIESDVFIDVYKMAEQGMKAWEIKEQINMLYVKHALLTAKEIHNEGDCISDDEIDMHRQKCLTFGVHIKLQSPLIC